MRRFRLVLALPLLLLLAQHGAVIHELSHVYYTAQTRGPQLSQNQQLPEGSICVTCRAFAQIGTPVAASLPGLYLPTASRLRIPERVYSIIGAKAPTARSRGPPQTSI